MIVREPKTKIQNLHPDVKERWNQMTQPPLPLKFKLPTSFPALTTHGPNLLASLKKFHSR
jgi:hypothetical protein